jgi:hypothetical protein
LSYGLMLYVRRDKQAPVPNQDREPYHPGKMAQDALAVLLFVAPLALCGALIVTVMSLLGQEPSQPETGAEILGIYAVSALRILPLAAFAVSPLRAIVEVIGDALLFLAPEVLDRRDEAIARVRAALAYMRSAGSDEIVVVAHGQGSLIAGKAALEASERIIRLVTFGSPVGSFYHRFLGRWSSGLASLHPLWINAYHSEDCVGGPIDGVRENCVMEHGGHTGYWADPRSWSIVDQVGYAQATESC